MNYDDENAEAIFSHDTGPLLQGERNGGICGRFAQLDTRKLEQKLNLSS